MNIDQVKETFLDVNIDVLLDLHDDLKATYEPLGYFNKSCSNKFIDLIMRNIYLNENAYDSSSEDENNNDASKKY
jgi:hypothetical protein